jgi:hypothetical protein
MLPSIRKRRAAGDDILEIIPVPFCRSRQENLLRALRLSGAGNESYIEDIINSQSSAHPPHYAPPSPKKPASWYVVTTIRIYGRQRPVRHSCPLTRTNSGCQRPVRRDNIQALTMAFHRHPCSSTSPAAALPPLCTFESNESFPDSRACISMTAAGTISRSEDRIESSSQKTPRESYTR